MTTAEDAFLGVGKDPLEALAETLRMEVIRAILYHERNAPRSLQKAIGPSQAGTPCDRQLALLMAEVEGKNVGHDPLPSMIGKAMHLTMEDVMKLANEVLGRERWLTETKVTLPIAGTSDCYDNDTFTVIDWKFPGTTAFKKYVTKGPSPEYDAQIDLYGLGYANLGKRVDNVGIMFIPRAGKLMHSHLYLRKFDRKHAEDVAHRNQLIKAVAQGFDLKNHPELAKMIPATPTDHCTYCPYFSPMPNGPEQCCGQTGDPNA